LPATEQALSERTIRSVVRPAEQVSSSWVLTWASPSVTRKVSCLAESLSEGMVADALNATTGGVAVWA
jgi:hypothetical protein